MPSGRMSAEPTVHISEGCSGNQQIRSRKSFTTAQKETADVEPTFLYHRHVCCESYGNSFNSVTTDMGKLLQNQDHGKESGNGWTDAEIEKIFTFQKIYFLNITKTWGRKKANKTMSQKPNKKLFYHEEVHTLLFSLYSDLLFIMDTTANPFWFLLRVCLKCI